VKINSGKILLNLEITALFGAEFGKAKIMNWATVQAVEIKYSGCVKS
jgi:hypothetical protein